MAATSAICNSWKRDITLGYHKHLASAGDTFKMALIIVTMSGTYGAASVRYSDITSQSPTDEVANGNGYTTGGATLTNVDTVVSSNKAVLDWSDNPVRWATASFSARAVMLYNSTRAALSPEVDNSVAVWDFGETKTASGGNFDIVLPAADATNAILRIA